MFETTFSRSELRLYVLRGENFSSLRESQIQQWQPRIYALKQSFHLYCFHCFHFTRTCFSYNSIFCFCFYLISMRAPLFCASILYGKLWVAFASVQSEHPSLAVMRSAFRWSLLCSIASKMYLVFKENFWVQPRRRRRQIPVQFQRRSTEELCGGTYRFVWAYWKRLTWCLPRPKGMLLERDGKHKLGQWNSFHHQALSS